MRLFNDKPWLPTDEGNEFSKEVRSVLKPLLAKWVARGASPREIAFIIMSEVMSEQSFHALRAQVQARQEQKSVAITMNEQQWRELQAEQELDKYDSGPHSDKGGGDD